MRSDWISKATRWRSTATTWLAKSVHLLLHHAEGAATESERSVASYEAGRLLSDVLGLAAELVPVLSVDDNEWQLKELRSDAMAISKAIRARDLAAKLSRTEGRTPEEAAAFEAKASALR